jgi:O-acetyl-ADP-ribose deacetylase (regulator of RNase III)
MTLMTTAGNMKAKYVIHTVGPRWRGGDAEEPELLASAYRESLKLAAANKLTSISFPSISTGAYGYPMEEAAPIASGRRWIILKAHPDIDLVRFVLFGREAYQPMRGP